MREDIKKLLKGDKNKEEVELKEELVYVGDFNV